MLKVKLKGKMAFCFINYRPTHLLYLPSHLYSGFILNKWLIWDSQSNILDEEQVDFRHRYFAISFFLVLFHILRKVWLKINFRIYWLHDFYMFIIKVNIGIFIINSLEFIIDFNCLDKSPLCANLDVPDQ